MQRSKLSLSMSGHAVNVFVSYSHADAPLVGPIVKLLRVNKSLVFQDADGIAPGTRWRDEIARALSSSNLVVVFWCQHASRSNEVSSEWKAAIEQRKDVLPLLLDATPLPSELAAFQWIDFRGTVGTNHGAMEAPDEAVEPAPSAPSAHARPMAPPKRRMWLAAVVTLATAATVLLVAFWGLSGVDSRSPVDVAPAPLPDEAFYSGWALPLLLTAIAALSARLVWGRLRRRQRRRPKRPAAAPPPGPAEVQQRIADRIQGEIRRIMQERGL